MGAAAPKSARQAPVRYVAKRLPSMDKVSMEQQFKKPHFTAQGINTRQDDVNTQPLMYVETSKDASSTQITDHAAPRWYLNTYMEMLDNVRTDQTVITGNLPLSWERDKYEPYALVRGRIDDEDLRWVLAPEQRKKGVDGLLPHTKLERQILQDILDTVELPRAQYRNYKGKLHKSIDDANQHITARKEQLERARESEILRQIGYTDEEITNEEQYLTNRPRGVKALDDLGVSVREKKRNVRAAQASELEDMLEQRRVEQIECGEVELTDEMLNKPEMVYRHRLYETRTNSFKHIYATDMGKKDDKKAKFYWWLERRNRVRRGVDKIYGVPLYNDRLATSEEQAQQQMRDAISFNYKVAQSQGAKGFSDPSAHFEDMMDVMRQNQGTSLSEATTEVHDNTAEMQHDVFRFPHTRHHPKKSSHSLVPECNMEGEGAGTVMNKVQGFSSPEPHSESDTVEQQGHRPTSFTDLLISKNQNDNKEK